MKRQINEGVRINQSKADIILNSKAEFHQTPLVRVVPVRGLQNDQELFQTRDNRRIIPPPRTPSLPSPSWCGAQSTAPTHQLLTSPDEGWNLPEIDSQIYKLLKFRKYKN